MGYNRHKKEMKKFYAVIIAVVVMGLCFSSCNKPEKLIIGKWEITSMKCNGQKGSKVEGDTWTFKDDGKFSGTIWTGYQALDIEAKYTVSEDELKISGGDLDNYGIDNLKLSLDITKKTMSVSGKLNQNNYDDYDDYDWKSSSGDSFSAEFEKKK